MGILQIFIEQKLHFFKGIFTFYMGFIFYMQIATWFYIQYTSLKLAVIVFIIRPLAV